MRVRSIAAGAGTGKTTELTRVIRESILNGECRPNAIIGTTFTIKAAGELVERVRQQFFKSGQIDLAERLSESLLGTVDGVCLRLLTRFAFEAGISPDIQIIAKAESEALWGSAVEDSCSFKEMETIRLLGERLCQGDGKELNWKTQIGLIAAKARENAISPSRLRAMAGLSSNELLSHFPAPAPVGALLDSALAQAIQNALQKLPAPKDSTKTTRDYISLLNWYSRDLAEGRLTWSQWVKLTKEEPAKASLAEAQPVMCAAQRYEEHPGLRDDIEQYTGLLFEFAARTLTLYQERKGERGLLDFVDLEQFTLDLLPKSAVAEVIREEFDLLLVDEFQDTNPIQLALFIGLAALVKCGAVWVGDMKQAIYGFRGSDPTLMDAVLTSVTSERMPTLGITYRARPELVQIFNDLFIPAFDRDLGQPKKDVELLANRPLNAELPVPLEFWVLSSGQNIKCGKPRQLTNPQAAQALAEGVVQLLANSNRTEDRDSGQLRPLQLRDIAILSRTNEGAATVAKALQERGLPVTLGASGLLSTPEARLAIACLRRMADQDDTLATAEIIAFETGHTPEQWLEDRLQYLASHPEDKSGSRWGLQPPLVNGSVSALDQAHSQVNQLTPAEALDLALGAGNVLATVSSWGPSENRSAQRRANLEALRGLALQYERSCAATHRPTTIAGFVFWCDQLEAQKLDSKATDERADSIHVLTYHTAKGLEWPVVICDDLENEHRSNLWEPTVRQERAFDAGDPLANRRIAFWPWPFGGQQKDIPLKERIENATAGQEALSAAAKEELRLLYVGFTRARDILILATREGQPSAWLELLEAPWFRPLDDAEVPVIGLLGPAQVPYCTRTIQPPAAIERPEPVTSYRWFPAPVISTSRLSALIVPSRQPLIDLAKVVQTIDLGDRLPITGSADRNRAFRKVIQLLKPGGALVMTFRQPPAPPEDSRGMHAVGLEEIEQLARDHGAVVVRSTSQNVTGPTGAILWTQIFIRLPDDGTGALPLLRHIILNDNKSSTYKLALLRTLCRIADGYLGMIRETDDEAVEIPHGLVALFWIRQFKPLLDLKFPPSPSNVGYRGLEFAKGSLALLMVSPLDLRVAGRFTQLQGAHLASSLSAAARNITKMPANFIRYPSGNQILSVQRSDRTRPGAALTLDREYLASFGWMRVPRHLWTALVRFNSWIEPAIIAEAEAESSLPWLGAAVAVKSRTSFRDSNFNAYACTTISKFRSGREDGRSGF